MVDADFVDDKIGNGQSDFADIGDAIEVEIRVVVTDIANAIEIAIFLLGIGDQGAVVVDIGDAIAIGIGAGVGTAREGNSRQLGSRREESAAREGMGTVIDIHRSHNIHIQSDGGIAAGGTISNIENDGVGGVTHGDGVSTVVQTERSGG